VFGSKLEESATTLGPVPWVFWILMTLKLRHVRPAFRPTSESMTEDEMKTIDPMVWVWADGQTSQRICVQQQTDRQSSVVQQEIKSKHGNLGARRASPHLDHDGFQ